METLQRLWSRWILTDVSTVFLKVTCFCCLPCILTMTTVFASSSLGSSCLETAFCKVHVGNKPTLFTSPAASHNCAAAIPGASCWRRHFGLSAADQNKLSLYQWGKVSLFSLGISEYTLHCTLSRCFPIPGYNLRSWNLSAVGSLSVLMLWFSSK